MDGPPGIFAARIALLLLVVLSDFAVYSIGGEPGIPDTTNIKTAWNIHKRTKRVKKYLRATAWSLPRCRAQTIDDSIRSARTIELCAETRAYEMGARKTRGIPASLHELDILVV